jgi:hypothetical protein
MFFVARANASLRVGDAPIGPVPEETLIFSPLCSIRIAVHAILARTMTLSLT